MDEFVIVSSEPEQDFELPSLKDPGFILAEILQIYPPDQRPHYWRRYEFNELTCGGSAYWIQEGEGLDHFLESIFPEEITSPGWWAITGITGTAYRGDGWTTDDDIDWDIGEIRPATQAEIDALYVETT